MGVNRVKSLRESKGLSQTALAEKAFTSQQQIQRIERGQLTRLDTAIKIADALGEPVDAVFPAMRAALKKLVSGDPTRLLSDKKLQEEFDRAGVDPEPVTWRFWFHLDSGVKRGVEVSSKVKSVLWSRLQTSPCSFIVFDGFEERFAINVERLAGWQFSFDVSPNVVGPDEVPEETPDPELKVWLGSAPEPWGLFLEPDDDFAERGEEMSEIQGLFVDLGRDPDAGDILRIKDADGETAFFRTGHIAMMAVKLTALSSVSEDSQDNADG